MAGLRDFELPDLEPGLSSLRRDFPKTGGNVDRLTEDDKRAIRLGFPGTLPERPEGVFGFKDPHQTALTSGITSEDVVDKLGMSTWEWYKLQQKQNVADQQKTRDEVNEKVISALKTGVSAAGSTIVDIYQAQPESVKNAEKASLSKILELIVAGDEVFTSIPSFLPADQQGEEKGQKTLSVLKKMAKFEISFNEGVDQLNKLNDARSDLEKLAGILIPGYGIGKVVSRGTSAVKGGLGTIGRTVDEIAELAKRGDDVPMGDPAERAIRAAEDASGVVPPNTTAKFLPEGEMPGITSRGSDNLPYTAIDNLRTPPQFADDVPLGSASQVGEGGVRAAEDAAGVAPRVAPRVVDEVGEGTVIPEDTTTKFVPTRKDSPNIPINPNSPLGKSRAMWLVGKESLPTDWPEQYLKWQENWNDAYWGLRRMQGNVGKTINILPGSDKDLISILTTGPGAAAAGMARYGATLKEIKSVAPNVSPTDINDFIFHSHAIEVFKVKTSREFVGTIKSAEESEFALGQLRAHLGPERFAQVEAGAAIMQRVYREERQRFVNSGIFTQEFADDMAARYPWYNPIHYVDYLDGQESLGIKVGGSINVVNDGIIGLSEKGIEAAVQAPMETLQSTLIRNAVRRQENDTAKAVITLGLLDDTSDITKIPGVRLVAVDEGKAIFRKDGQDIPGTISFMENGVRQIYEVPDWMYRETNMLNVMTKDPVASIVGAFNGISRTAFVRQNPGFLAKNIVFDSLTAFITRGIMPQETAAVLIRSITNTGNQRKLDEAFKLSGGVQDRYFSDAGTHLFKEFGEDVTASGGLVVSSVGGWRSALKSTVRAPFRPIPAVGTALEQAPRQALFRRELSKNLPNWKNMTSEEIAASPEARAAAAESVELTLNFARGGYNIKSINRYVIFLNATMEGMKLPFRTIPGNRAAQMRFAGVMAGAGAAAKYNMSFPEYFDIPLEIRLGSQVLMQEPTEQRQDGSWIPNYIAYIPVTREWALAIGLLTMAEEQLFTDNPTEYASYAKSIMSKVTPVDMMPAPVILAQLLGQKGNYDFFRGQPIVPRELENAPVEEQTTPWVSTTVEMVANQIGVSPLRAQSALSGIFGGAGSTATSVSDYILNWLMPVEKNPRIQNLLEDYNELETPEARNEMRANLSEEDRNDLDEALRAPRDRKPFIDPALRAFSPGRGGELRNLGQEIAEKETGISVKQTTTVSRKLRNFSERQLTQQQEDDRQLTLEGSPAGITHLTWRKNRRDRGEAYANFIDELSQPIDKGGFPDAAQISEDTDAAERYFELVATVAGSQPDSRTRGQVLAAAYYSIEPPVREDGEIDFNAFFEMRDNYVISLSDEKQTLLQRTLDSKSTATEREYTADLKIIRPYFKITRDKVKEMGVEKEYNLYLRTAGKYQQRGFLEEKENFTLKFTLDTIIPHAKEEWLADNRNDDDPSIDPETILFKWDYLSGQPKGGRLKGQMYAEIQERSQAGEFTVQD